MTYKIEGKYYELNNEDMMEVRKNQRELDLSEEDAVRMFFEDWEYIPAGSKVKIERVKDIQTKKEYAKSDKPRKTSTKERKVDDPHGHLEPKRLRDVGFDVNLYLCLLAGPDAVAVGAAYFQNIVATRDVSYIDRRLVL